MCAAASSAEAVAGGVKAAADPAAVTKEAVRSALELGYRFLDCAEFYANEAAVGAAIAVSGIPRSELFLVSKCWTTTIYSGAAAVEAPCRCRFHRGNKSDTLA